MLIAAAQIRQLHEDRTEAWHRALPSTTLSDTPLGLVEQQHLANFLLWHEEDRARDPRSTDTVIAAVKRSIDLTNQRRNDLTELLDEAVIGSFASQNPSAPLASETPGMMIDRLSILALKIFHTRDEVVRASTTEVHRARNRDRLAILELQRNDLFGCLDELLVSVEGGKRRVKVYRQLKMYNDSELNPVLYASSMT